MSLSRETRGSATDAVAPSESVAATAGQTWIQAPERAGATVGGVISTATSGHRRLRFGAIRDSVLQVVDLFRAGNPPHIVPDEQQATYERRCTAKHAKIDWNKPVKQVYDLIRGTNPAPGAWTTVGGKTLGVFECARVAGDGISGRIKDVTDEGFTVQCIGGRILVKRVRPEGQGKVSAAEWAADAGIKSGDELGN